MYLVLGAPDCQYCQMAKAKLADARLSYHYVDLSKKYKDWRQVFTEVPAWLIRGQRSIPLIFFTPDDRPYPSIDTLDRWKFVGGYADLRC